MTEREVARLVAVLIAAFPSAKLTPETLAIYERMLGDLDYLVANAAVERLLATAKWLPTIAEIRETSMALTAGPRKPGAAAWGELLDAIGRYGAHRTPGFDFRFDDPVVQQCVRALGWRELCLSESQTADRARFVELYDQLAAARRIAALSEGLPAQQRLAAAQQRVIAAPTERPTPTPTPERRPSDERAGATDIAAALTALGHKPTEDPT